VVVQFREGTVDYGPSLGRVLRRTRYKTAERKVLAVLCKGISEGIPLEEIRLWIVAQPSLHANTRRYSVKPQGSDEQLESSENNAVLRGRSPILGLVQSPKQWRRMCDAAKRKVDSSPSRTGEDAVNDKKRRVSNRAVARRLYAGLLLLDSGDDRMGQ
jgi:hypothetical protein